MICNVIGFPLSSSKFEFIKVISDAFKLNAIPKIVMLDSSLYILSMKSDLLGVAIEETPLSNIAQTESILNAMFESLDDIAVNNV